MSSFIKDLVSVGGSKLIIILSGITTSIITARFLGPEKNGVIAALLVYPGIFMSFGSLGIRQSTTYLLGQKKFNEAQIKTGIIQIWGITTAISLVSCYLLMKYLSSYGNNLLLIILALAPIPFTLFNTYNSGVFLGKNEIKKFNRINWIPPLIILLITFFFLLSNLLDIKEYLLALLAGPITVSLLLLYRNSFIRAFSIKINFVLIKRLLGLGIIYAFALLIINLNYKFDIIMLEHLSSSYETGIYSKGAGVTEFLWQIPMLLSTIVFARSATSKEPLLFSYKVAQLLRVSFVLIIIGSLLLWAFSEFIIISMFGEEFRPSSIVLEYLLPGVVLLTIYKVMNMDLAGKGRPWISIYAMLPGLAINIALNFLLIPKMGAMGAALSSTISYSIAAILFLYFYSKAVQLKISEIIFFKKTDFDPIFKLCAKFLNRE